MALDYKNLPLLMTIEDIAEVFRCTPGTIRRKLASEPAWLSPVRHGLMRRQLFATVDVMAHLGHAAPAPAPAPLQDAVDPWDQAASEAALDEAAATNKRRQMEERHRRYEEAIEAGNRRVATHRPSARLREVLWTARTYAKYETDATETLFRIYLYFQPRFRTEGGPAVIPIPRAGPEWTRLETDAEMHALIAEIKEVMAKHDHKRAAERLAKKKRPDA